MQGSVRFGRWLGAAVAACVVLPVHAEDADKAREHYSTGLRAFASLWRVHRFHPGLSSQSRSEIGELPRWAGDTNFMTTVSETRVLPEGLDVTWEKLKAAWG